MPKRIVFHESGVSVGREARKKSRGTSVRSLFALIVVLGVGYFLLDLTDRFYYDPICQRYADSHQLKFRSSKSASRKHHFPAECFFDDKKGNIKRVEVDTLTLTSADWVRRALSWVAMIGGVGGSVWLASVIGGFKLGRRRRKES